MTEAVKSEQWLDRSGDRHRFRTAVVIRQFFSIDAFCHISGYLKTGRLPLALASKATAWASFTVGHSNYLDH